MADYEELAHQSRLKDWEGHHASATHSDFIASTIGIFCMKAVLTLNGGALLATLAAYPDLRVELTFAVAISTAAKFYLWGLTAGLLTALLAYIYQSIVTANEWNQMAIRFPSEGKSPPFPWAARSASILRWPMIGLAIASGTLFLIGCFELLVAFNLNG